MKFLKTIFFVFNLEKSYIIPVISKNNLTPFNDFKCNVLDCLLYYCNISGLTEGFYSVCKQFVSNENSFAAYTLLKMILSTIYSSNRNSYLLGIKTCNSFIFKSFAQLHVVKAARVGCDRCFSLKPVKCSNVYTKESNRFH